MEHQIEYLTQKYLEQSLDKSPDLTTESNVHRANGNEAFGRQDYESALIEYNHAIRTARDYSPQLACAYANRSALMAKRELWSYCRDDIDRALHLNVDSDLTLADKWSTKLIARRDEADASPKIPRSRHDGESPKLPRATGANRQALHNGEHVYMPGCSSAVTVDYTTTKGRHLVANDDIPAGALLLTEEAYVTAVGDVGTIVCNHCCLPLDELGGHNSVLYCNGCNHEAIVYCSAVCKESAWRAYHRWECAWLMKIPLCQNLNFRAALRIILRTPLAEIVAQCDAEENSKLGISSTDDFASNFTSIMSLTGQASDEYRQKVAVVTSVICAHLGRMGYFARLDWPKDLGQVELEKRGNVEKNAQLENNGQQETNGLQEKKLEAGVTHHPKEKSREALTRKLLDRMILKVNWNCYEIGPYRFDDAMIDADRASSTLKIVEDERGVDVLGVYAIQSLINHSCLPNMSHYFHGRTSEFRAASYIDKGTELTTEYGQTFGNGLRAARQAYLVDRYGFTCACEACSSAHYAVLERSMLDAHKCAMCAACIFGDALLDECQVCGFVNDFDEANEKATQLEKMLAVIVQLKDRPMDARQRGKLVGRIEHGLRDVQSMFYPANRRLNALRISICSTLCTLEWPHFMQISAPILKLAIVDCQRVLSSTSPTVEFLLGNAARLEVRANSNATTSREAYDELMTTLYGQEGGRLRTRLRYGGRARGRPNEVSRREKVLD